MLLLGFVLGMRHATDPDHVVAVTAIVARERRIWASTAIGALWGVGHTVTILIVGCAIILFHVVIPARVGLGLELAVASMLVALGTAYVMGLVARAHDEASHAPPRCGRTLAGIARPLVIGLVHGVAGSAAVALLVVTAISNAAWAAVYLVVFGVGTILGMMVLTTVLSAPIALTGDRVARANVWLVRATGVGSIAFGLFLAYQLVAVHGMFASAPSWTPQ